MPFIPGDGPMGETPIGAMLDGGYSPGIMPFIPGDGPMGETPIGAMLDGDAPRVGDYLDMGNDRLRGQVEGCLKKIGIQGINVDDWSWHLGADGNGLYIEGVRNTKNSQGGSDQVRIKIYVDNNLNPTGKASLTFYVAGNQKGSYTRGELDYQNGKWQAHVWGTTDNNVDFDINGTVTKGVNSTSVSVNGKAAVNLGSSIAIAAVGGITIVIPANGGKIQVNGVAQIGAEVNAGSAKITVTGGITYENGSFMASGGAQITDPRFGPFILVGNVYWDPITRRWTTTGGAQINR
jgi:hypothetical protein